MLGADSVAPYASRSVDSLIVEHEGLVSTSVFTPSASSRGLCPGSRCDKLTASCASDKVNALCKRSLVFDVIDVPRLERMLKQALSDEEAAPPGRVIQLPKSRFARDPASFSTMAPKGGES